MLLLCAHPETTVGQIPGRCGQATWHMKSPLSSAIGSSATPLVWSPKGALVGDRSRETFSDTWAWLPEELHGLGERRGEHS